MAGLACERIIERLRGIQGRVRDALVAHVAGQSVEVLARVEREEVGDTIFGIDVAVEGLLLQEFEEWGREQRFTVLGEGLPDEGLVFGREGVGGVPFRLLVDPIDGTRGLMFDKRSAWCLMGAAPDRGVHTRLGDVEVAVMTELPTTRQHVSDVLWAAVGRGTRGERCDLVRGTRRELPVRPSSAGDLRHGFASVANYFPGGKALIGGLDEAIVGRAMGGWNPEKAEVYSDQYICSGGQLAECALGRDRFVLDVRPLVHAKLGVRSSLACRPYDLVTWLCATEAGCILLDPFGEPLDAPLDVSTNLSFACYANRRLAELLVPIVRDEVARRLQVDA